MHINTYIDADETRRETFSAMGRRTRECAEANGGMERNGTERNGSGGVEVSVSELTLGSHLKGTRVKTHPLE